MEDPRFYGTYARFEVPATDQVGALMGRDNIVGDQYEIVIKYGEGGTQGTHAWMHNRFGADIAFFDEETSYKLQVLLAQDKTVKAILSFVAATEQEDGTSLFWGEAAIVAYDKRYESEFETFIQKICDKMSDAVRPDIALSPSGIDQVISSKGAWMPEGTVPMPEGKSRAYALLKDDRSIGDKLVEQGRKGNPGCYVFGYGAIAFFIIAIILVVKNFFGF